jgi:hypothetical protein
LLCLKISSLERKKRQIFIHPSLAYGISTTLPPCIDLIITLKLIDIDERFSQPLPPLTPLDLSWIKNPSLYHNIETSIQQIPGFLGSFYRNLLDKIEGPDKKSMIIESFLEYYRA